MYRSILVPLDGSVFGEHALPLALSLARRSGATIHLAHVHVLPAPMYLQRAPHFESTYDARARKIARAYLDKMVERLAAFSDVPVTSVYLEGDVAESLYEHAVAKSVDLVVMTTHGRGPLTRFWMGSVTDELVRRLPMPVLVMRPTEEAPDLTREVAFKHLLIPLDGSPLAEQILEPAVALGKLMGADYTLLQAVPPEPYPAYDPTIYTGAEMAQAVLEQHVASARAYLEKVAQRLRSQGLEVRTRLTLDQPASAIFETTSRDKIDLIAIETHARHGVARALLGSVADKVLRGTLTPVLVHRPLKK
jgi:nucleotide-binding universal stress UspA family protein